MTRVDLRARAALTSGSPFAGNRVESGELAVEAMLLELDADLPEDTPVVPRVEGGLIELARLYAGGRADATLHTADVVALIRQATLTTHTLEAEALDQLFDIFFGRADIALSKRARGWLEDLLPPTTDAVVTREDVRALKTLRKARSVLARAMRDLLPTEVDAAPLANLEIRFHAGYQLVLDVVTTDRALSARELARRVRRVLRSRGLRHVRARVVVRAPATADERAWFYA